MIRDLWDDLACGCKCLGGRMGGVFTLCRSTDTWNTRERVGDEELAESAGN